MGANTFLYIVRGKTAKEAFQKATVEARYENGHGGNTGTIAEKYSFTLIQDKIGIGGMEPSEYQKACLNYAIDLIDASDPRINDKWGPAGCIDLLDGSYLFFGWASS